MHKYEIAVLNALKEHGWSTEANLASLCKLGAAEVSWALEGLKTKGMIQIEYEKVASIKVNPEGMEYAGKGLPEEKLMATLAKRPLRVSEFGESEKIGLQWAKKLGLVSISGGMVSLTPQGKEKTGAELKAGAVLKKLASGNYPKEMIVREKETISDLSRRGLIELSERNAIKSISLTVAGESQQSEDSSGEYVDAIDRSIIATGSWEGKKFKRYDVKVNVERRVPAMRHPLKIAISSIKDAYLSMGFKEVSGPAVESSFWVFDSLFVPQDHPARDAQDTFYVSNVKQDLQESEEYIRRVKKAHGKGWHSKWNADTASQMLLRTHTTSVSSRYLYKIVSELSKNPDKYELPIKLFSVGRVFRNEAIDYRHLADFYQSDGLIIGKNLTLSNLFDELTKIYDFVGLKIRFKPSYFPFVEPGVEFSAYSDKHKEWIELGGAGMLREEITGVNRKKLSVLAWGPGIDRILLIKDPSISSVSELYNNGLGWIRSRRLV